MQCEVTSDESKGRQSYKLIIFFNIILNVVLYFPELKLG